MQPPANGGGNVLSRRQRPDLLRGYTTWSRLGWTSSQGKWDASVSNKSLIIVESPHKSKTIAQFLGKNYTVKASVGHIRDLPTSQFGVDIEGGFVPKYVTIRGQGKVVSELKTAAKKADRVFLATDPDREGEAISWHLAQALDLGDKAKRIEFHEITPRAVKAALVTPRDIDMQRVNAQQARRILDRIIGYQLSPLLWKKVRRGLSAGRVQSVAVRLIVEREREIRDFNPVEYWTIDAHLATRMPARFSRPVCSTLRAASSKSANETEARPPSTGPRRSGLTSGRGTPQGKIAESSPPSPPAPATGSLP